MYIVYEWWKVVFGIYEKRGRSEGHGGLLCVAGNIDACKKIFMDFRDHSRVKLVAGRNIFLLYVYKK